MNEQIVKKLHVLVVNYLMKWKNVAKSRFPSVLGKHCAKSEIIQFWFCIENV